MSSDCAGIPVLVLLWRDLQLPIYIQPRKVTAKIDYTCLRELNLNLNIPTDLQAEMLSGLVRRFYIYSSILYCRYYIPSCYIGCGPNYNVNKFTPAQSEMNVRPPMIYTCNGFIKKDLWSHASTTPCHFYINRSTGNNRNNSIYARVTDVSPDQGVIRF